MENYIDDDFDFGFETDEVNENDEILDYLTANKLIKNVLNPEVKKPEPINIKELVKKDKVTKEAKAKMIKARLKEECFFRNESLLNIIYYLGNGIIFIDQLIKIMQVLDITSTPTSIKKAIKEVKDIGFIKEQQLLSNHKRYCIYLTKYPIGKIVGKSSVEVTAIRITQDKILSSIFKIERFIDLYLHKIAKHNIAIKDMNEALMNEYTYLFTQKHQDNLIYGSINYNLKRDGLMAVIDNVFNSDMKVAQFDLINKINKSSKNKKQIDIPMELMDAKRIKLDTTSIVGSNKDNTISKKNIDINLFNIKNLINRNFNIEYIQYVECGLNAMNIRLNYLDIKDTINVQILHRDIGYAYMMFQRYFKTDNIILEVNVLEWNKISKNKAYRNSFKANKETGHKICFNEYYKAGINPARWKDGIKVYYLSLDLDVKYNIKSDR